jgi:hypothetical protein
LIVAFNVECFSVGKNTIRISDIDWNESWGEGLTDREGDDAA